MSILRDVSFIIYCAVRGSAATCARQLLEVCLAHAKSRKH
jgi:hypothetical protein